MTNPNPKMPDLTVSPDMTVEDVKRTLMHAGNDVLHSLFGMLSRDMGGKPWTETVPKTPDEVKAFGVAVGTVVAFSKMYLELAGATPSTVPTIGAALSMAFSELAAATSSGETLLSLMALREGPHRPTFEAGFNETATNIYRMTLDTMRQAVENEKRMAQNAGQPAQPGQNPAPVAQGEVCPGCGQVHAPHTPAPGGVDIRATNAANMLHFIMMTLMTSGMQQPQTTDQFAVMAVALRLLSDIMSRGAFEGGTTPDTLMTLTRQALDEAQRLGVLVKMTGPRPEGHGPVEFVVVNTDTPKGERN